MPSAIAGLHHVTAIASDPQQNLEFYTEVLGLRFVKRTINFDDPETYHFYFGDDRGTPGTILTFFPWPGATRGTAGAGETAATALLVPSGSLGFWEQRLRSVSIPAERLPDRFGAPVLRFSDPDGMALEMIGSAVTPASNPSRFSPVPAEHALLGFHGVTLSERSLEHTEPVLTAMGLRRIAEDGRRVRFAADGSALGNVVDVIVDPSRSRGRLGAGSVHHIAFRVPDDASQQEWREFLPTLSLNVTPVRDRIYFHSIYFREHGGVLFELATDQPGFAVDEPLETLGESLKLPPWLAEHRSALEPALPAIELPHQRVEQAHG